MAELTPQEVKFLERAETIAKAEIELWVHPKNGGSFDFEKDRGLFTTIKAYFSDVASARFGFVPGNVLDQGTQRIESLITALQRAGTFNIREGDPNGNSQGIINSLRSAWFDAYNFITPHLALARVSSAAITEEVSTLKALVAKIQEQWKTESGGYAEKLKDADAKLKARLEEAEKVMTAAREAAATNAVAAQASEFEKEAGRCLQASTRWFTATIVMVIVSLVVVWCMFLKADQRTPHTDLAAAVASPLAQSNQPSTMSNAPVAASVQTPAPGSESLETKIISVALLQQTIARVLIVSLLYAAVVWFARNCFACRHNYTVNRHRRNAMQTFRAFVEGTKDPVTQDFILRQAAACAFSPQQTGYLKDESLPTPGPASQIFESAKSEAK